MIAHKKKYFCIYINFHFQISSETKDILLEVTGCNLNTCKKVMDTLLVDMLKLGIGNKATENNEEDVPKNTLIVQQMKIVDEEGKMKVVYPSRTDICSENISVLRCWKNAFVVAISVHVINGKSVQFLFLWINIDTIYWIFFVCV